MEPLLVGIAGGSGSGKTTLAEGLVRALPTDRAVVIPADAYYRDLAHLPPAERARHNFDEPAALDEERLCADLGRLGRGEPAARPVYDFVSHTRRPEVVSIVPRPVVIVEGILVLALPALRPRLGLKVFVDADEAVRLARRIARDVGERGRTRASVEQQFARHTRPMHRRHVEPSRAFADLVVSGDKDLGRAVSLLLAHIPSG
jgi:uridine kinase